LASAAATFTEPEKRIGRITAMVNCRWALPATATTMGADVIADRCFGLESGILEITYDTGAKVVLKGPALFSAPSRATGWLFRGKVTVSTPPVTDQPLFCIRTPTAVVIERGDCQFGVEVEMGAEATQPDGGRPDVNLEKPAMSRVYVFRGKAEFCVPERWAPQKALLSKRDQLFVEVRPDCGCLVHFVKDIKLTPEFMAQWFKAFSIVTAKTKEETATEKRFRSS
jgi:hypothetical protein